MNRYDRMTNSIKSTWKTFGLLIMVLAMIVISTFVVFGMKAKLYKQEYESTTWYETTAKYTRSNEYTERDEDGDDVTKYTNFYKYKAKDGNTYEYADINCSSSGDEGDTVQIYVDEKDNSHTLEILNDSGMKNIKFVIMAICLPVFIFFTVVLIVQYIVREIAKAIMNRY